MMLTINNVAMNSKNFTSMLYDSTTWFESHWSYNTFTKQLQKNQKEKRIEMLTVNSISAFPLSSIIELGATRDLGSMETPGHACNWIPLCKSLSQKVSSWL
jgi:hypothetical protein